MDTPPRKFRTKQSDDRCSSNSRAGIDAAFSFERHSSVPARVRHLLEVTAYTMRKGGNRLRARRHDFRPGPPLRAGIGPKRMSRQSPLRQHEWTLTGDRGAGGNPPCPD